MAKSNRSRKARRLPPLSQALTRRQPVSLGQEWQPEDVELDAWERVLLQAAALHDGQQAAKAIAGRAALTHRAAAHAVRISERGEKQLEKVPADVATVLYGLGVEDGRDEGVVIRSHPVEHPFLAGFLSSSWLRLRIFVPIMAARTVLIGRTEDGRWATWRVTNAGQWRARADSLKRLAEVLDELVLDVEEEARKHQRSGKGPLPNVAERALVEDAEARGWTIRELAARMAATGITTGDDLPWFDSAAASQQRWARDQERHRRDLEELTNGWEDAFKKTRQRR